MLLHDIFPIWKQIILLTSFFLALPIIFQSRVSMQVRLAVPLALQYVVIYSVIQFFYGVASGFPVSDVLYSFVSPFAFISFFLTGAWMASLLARNQPLFVYLVQFLISFSTLGILLIILDSIFQFALPLRYFRDSSQDSSMLDFMLSAGESFTYRTSGLFASLTTLFPFVSFVSIVSIYISRLGGLRILSFLNIIISLFALAATGSRAQSFLYVAFLVAIIGCYIIFDKKTYNSIFSRIFFIAFVSIVSFLLYQFFVGEFTNYSGLFDRIIDLDNGVSERSEQWSFSSLYIPSPLNILFGAGLGSGPSLLYNHGESSVIYFFNQLGLSGLVIVYIPIFSIIDLCLNIRSSLLISTSQRYLLMFWSLLCVLNFLVAPVLSSYESQIVIFLCWGFLFNLRYSIGLSKKVIT